MLVERFPSQTPGKKNVYRGMKITMPSSSMASQVRKLVRTGESAGISRNELTKFVLSQLEGDSTGASWSASFDVATSFAGALGATNRGKELHVILQATVDEESGYDPQEAGEEPGMFYDEAEVRFEPGADIPLTGIYVFIKSKDEFAKQRSQYQSLMTKQKITR